LDYRKIKMNVMRMNHRIQTHQGFISNFGPELAGSLAPTLLLTTGRFDRATADRFFTLSPAFVIHPVFVSVKLLFGQAGFPSFAAAATARQV
jgi:hypothetical protein